MSVTEKIRENLRLNVEEQWADSLTFRGEIRLVAGITMSRTSPMNTQQVPEVRDAYMKDELAEDIRNTILGDVSQKIMRLFQEMSSAVQYGRTEWYDMEKEILEQLR